MSKRKQGRLELTEQKPAKRQKPSPYRVKSFNERMAKMLASMPKRMTK